jgi:hypothetical protein
MVGCSNRSKWFFVSPHSHRRGGCLYAELQSAGSPASQFRTIFLVVCYALNGRPQGIETERFFCLQRSNLGARVTIFPLPLAQRIGAVSAGSTTMSDANVSV